jgi:catechol 2,3-dioxygenase-like lactoylglutathione lyase family enzyme
MDPEFMGIRHVALNVLDVAKSVDFYCTVLGMQIEWKPDDENVYLTSGSDNLAIHKLRSQDPPAAAQTLHHIGFVVRTPQDVDKWADRLRKLGVPIAQEPKTHRDGARSFYFNDPNGILIQLIYHPPISDK